MNIYIYVSIYTYIYAYIHMYVHIYAGTAASSCYRKLPKSPRHDHPQRYSMWRRGRIHRYRAHTYLFTFISICVCQFVHYRYSMQWKGQIHRSVVCMYLFILKPTFFLNVCTFTDILHGVEDDITGMMPHIYLYS